MDSESATAQKRNSEQDQDVSEERAHKFLRLPDQQGEKHQGDEQHPEEPPMVKPRISTIGAFVLKNKVNAIILPDGSEVDISVNENFEETQLRQHDPIIYENCTEF